MKQTKLLLSVLFGLFLIPILVNGQLSTTTTTKTIEISPSQIIETRTCPVGCTCSGDTTTCPVEPSCKSPCVKSGDTCTCPVEKGICTSHADNEGCTIVECTDGTNTKSCPATECLSPCIKSGETCTCPAEKTWVGILKKCVPPTTVEAWSCGKCYNYTLVLSDEKELTFNDKNFSNLEEFVNKTVKLTGYENKAVLIMCPIQITATNIELTGGAETCPAGCVCSGNTTTCPVEPSCKVPCIKSGDTCTCPVEPKTCPVGCTCNGDVTTCPVEGIKPIEAKISSESGTKTVFIEKVPNGLSLQSEKATAVTTEKLVIEGNKLFLKTSTGNKEIKILPEEASSKATAVTKVNTIELKEESQQPIYSVKGTKQAKLFFIIPVSMQIETKVNAESGDVISIQKPWWSFLTR